MVEQLAKIAQGRQADAGSRFLGELRTGQRIQHPGRHGDLNFIRQRDDDAISRMTPEPTDDLYRFAVEWMVTVVDDCGG